jgi:hypothetical protein
LGDNPRAAWPSSDSAVALSRSGSMCAQARKVRTLDGSDWRGENMVR